MDGAIVQTKEEGGFAEVGSSIANIVPIIPPTVLPPPFSCYKEYQAEIAKSNRAQCHETSCKCNIGKGSLKLGHYQGENMYISWYHAPCAFRSVQNRYLRNPAITSTNMIQGYDTLSEEHKQLILSLINGTYVEPPAGIDYANRPKRACVAAKEAEKTVEKTTDEQQPKKRAKKNSN